jgi:oligopeptide/dipeptide ABC transporter ATP-binding protein
VTGSEDVSLADAPTIVELSPEDVLRARGEAIANAGTGRKADHLLEVRGLSTHFSTPDGVVQAVGDVSFDVGYGETLGLVGESGCGKSVTALSIARLVPDPPGKIVAGSIMFDGIDLLKLSVEDMRKLRGKEIGFIFQDPLTSLNPTLTIGYQIGEAIKEHMGLPDKAAKDRIVELLAKVGIPRAKDRLKDYPFQFSGGMRQRVMIAIALSCDPKLILADEPTTALDVTIQAQILRLLRDLVKERGVSVLFTTHDLGTAYELCDRVVVMYAGQEMESAPTDAFFERPAHPYTRRLLDSLPTPGGEIRDIPGEVPSLIGPPPGCRFHPRCDYATAECRARRPDAHAVDGAHRVRCYHPLSAA